MFICFLLYWTQASRTRLKIRNNGDGPCLIPDLRDKEFSVFPSSILLTVSFKRSFFVILFSVVDIRLFRFFFYFFSFFTFSKLCFPRNFFIPSKFSNLLTRLFIIVIILIFSYYLFKICICYLCLLFFFLEQSSQRLILRSQFWEMTANGMRFFFLGVDKNIQI